MQNEMDWLIERRAHLDVLVDVPGSLFAIVDRLHGGIGQAGDVSAGKHPGFTGLHGFAVHLRCPPSVQLYWFQGLLHCSRTQYYRDQSG